MIKNHFKKIINKMALSYSPVDIRGLAVSPILEQVFSQKLFQMVMLLSMTTLSKHNTEAGVSVTAQLYTGSALANLGSLNVTDRLISPIKLEYKQTFLQEALRNSRFNTTMKVVLGKLKVLNLVQQFLQWLVQQYHKMLKTFSGWYYYCYKVAIAALVPGAGQGSITAASNCYCCFGCWTS
jgi:hypothetical protein